MAAGRMAVKNRLDISPLTTLHLPIKTNSSNALATCQTVIAYDRRLPPYSWLVALFIVWWVDDLETSINNHLPLY